MCIGIPVSLMHAGLHVGGHVCTGVYVGTPTSVYMYIWMDG